MLISVLSRDSGRTVVSVLFGVESHLGSRNHQPIAVSCLSRFADQDSDVYESGG